MYAYKFASTACAEKPDNEITRLLEKTLRKESLSRGEKDRVAEILYGTFGAQEPVYRLAGWAWDLSRSLPRFLVRFPFNSMFQVYSAPDKTALRRVISPRPAEIVQA